MVEQYISDLDDFLLESYIQEVYEGIDLSAFKDVFKKIGKEISTHFKFIGTFGMVITLFFPLVDNLMKHMTVQVEISPTTIVLATIGAVSILIDNNKDKLKWVLKELGDKEWDGIIAELANALGNIKHLFSTIAFQLGKVVKSFADMLAYTMLFVPFLKALLDFVQTNKIDPSDLSGMALSAGTGIAIVAGKNIIEWLINQIAMKNKKLKLEPLLIKK